MSGERKAPLWPWIVTLLIGLPVLYVLSFGPACWITSRTHVGASALPTVYRPITWVMWRDERVMEAMNSYAEFGSAGSWHWLGVGDLEESTFFWSDEVIFTSGPPSIGSP
jgi:hypothetical protein